ncbi:MAG TPA: hypothetical protein VEK79_06285 [Thermoanaerobaculia bacterium]|nr:hypothetical protein [Thermoanaerobaculia bacterium]
MTHLTTADFARVRSGDMSADDAEALGRHIAQCNECAAKATETLELDDVADAFAAAFTMEDERVEAPRLPRRTFWWAGAAAAAIAIIFFLLPRPDTPSLPPPGAVTRTTTAPAAPSAVDVPVRPAEWDALVAQTRRTGVLPFPPEIRELGLVTTVRGETPRAGGDDVWPAATAIDDVRPALRWPATSGARYTVTVIADGEEIARSQPLEVARWRVPSPLPRGRMYRWQVAVEGGTASFTIPRPPAPPAIFRVLSAEEHAVLERARAEAGDDHLLLALLYARVGVADEARKELAAYEKATGDPFARRLLEQLPETRSHGAL